LHIRPPTRNIGTSIAGLRCSPVNTLEATMAKAKDLKELFVETLKDRVKVAHAIATSRFHKNSTY
jgi:hypothetical protein